MTAILTGVVGTGSMTMVANLAGVLAGAGRRVMVLDSSYDVTRVAEYLEPFSAGPVAVPEALLRTGDTRAGNADRTSPAAERFILPAAGGHIDVVTWSERAATPAADPVSAGDLRGRLRACGYDDVLVDAPTRPAGSEVDMIAALCDKVVVCFRPRSVAVREAGDLAREVTVRAPGTVSILPVAMMFDTRYPARAEAVRAAIKSAFTLPPQGDRDAWIEIPYLSTDTLDPLLAILVEEPSTDSTLHVAYGRLAAIITGGVVSESFTVPAGIRARYRRMFGLDPAAVSEKILVVYAAPDRPWADWVSGVLAQGGVQAGRMPVGAFDQEPADLAGVVVVDSARLEESSHLDAVAELVRQLPSIRISLDGVDSIPDARTPSIAASGDARMLRAHLFRHLQLFDSPTAPAERMRLPGEQPDIFEVPARNQHFVGRDESIEQLRDRLTGPDGGGVVTLSGAPGVGKSSLALEYAHRFCGDYDLVWWVPASDTATLVASLAQLAGKLDVRGTQHSGAATALERLQVDPYHQRFLLVYDNVDHPVELELLLPTPGLGHVIVTTASALSPDIELGAMRLEDGVRLLTDRVPGLSQADATTVALDVRNLPVALELTAAWLIQAVAVERRAGSTVADAASWAGRAFAERRSEAAQDKSPGTGIVPQVVGVVIASLCESGLGRIAVLLARLCAFLSPDGIGLELLRSAGMRRALTELSGTDGDALRLDSGEIDRVLWLGARYGLFRVSWGVRHSLHQHRVVQAALRAGMTEVQRAAHLASVHEVLAEFAPSEVDEAEPHYLRRFAELQQHVAPAGAQAATTDTVRRWLVNQVRYLYVHGGPRVHSTAVEPTRKLLEEWTTRYGTGDALRLRLAAQLANLHRALGNPAEALRLDEEALADQRRAWEPRHPQTLITARGRGGDLRGLGQFTDAYLEDQATWQGFTEELGEDHPQTLMAANNYATSLFLSGDAVAACDVAEQNYVRRLRLLGADNLMTCSSLAKLGTYRRELGDYDAARDMLDNAAQRLHALLPDPHPTKLSVQYQRAVTRRFTGSPRTARDATESVVREYRELLGPGHPRTLAGVLSLAAATRATHQFEDAVHLADEALRGFLPLAADRHPFVALCRLGVGLAQLRTVEAGLAELTTAVESLRAELGDTHPWTLAASVDHAVALAATGDAVQGGNLLEETHAACLEFLGARHPYTSVAAHNFDLVRDDPAGSGESTWKEIDVDIPDT
ncbi:FxSxx-COOH system tetratricopeptide repeat protein [Amycolatopsis sp. NPDC051128]|uniref:FxSxx-COOH system tetratricopeptide repeat protein n=1 Tax=Amycolatopsis sp. NPDC051128 TaxID=3155412 RepID=UPI00341EC0C2